MNSVTLLWHSLKHTPHRQLVARLRLIAKRQMSDAAVGLHIARRRTVRTPKLSSRPPHTVFPPRSVVGELDSTSVSLDLVGTHLHLTEPMDWHPRTLERGSLEMLTLHYTEFLEGIASKEATMIDWIVSNPVDSVGSWRDSWNSYAISIRCVVWMQQLGEYSSSFSGPGTDEIIDSLSDQVRFLSDNIEFDIRGNHLVKNLKCLMWAGRFFDGTEAETWFRTGEQLLKGAIDEQVLDDGMHFERSASYHNQVLADFIECFSLMDPSPLKARVGDTLDRMAQVSVDLTHPDGFPSMMNDGGFTMAYRSDAIVTALTHLNRAVPIQRHDVYLPKAGYFGQRSGNSLFLADCGPIGPDSLPAHAHGDVLSFEWAIAGDRIIVDPGVFEYKVGPNRKYSRSTAAHNTITVAGHDQAQFWSSFRVGKRPDVQVEQYDSDSSGMTLTGSHNGFSDLRGAPTHHRKFELGSSTLTVSDRIYGGAGQTVAGSYLVSPVCTVTQDVRGVTVEHPLFSLRVMSNAKLSLEQARYSTNLGDSEQTTRIVTHLGSAPVNARTTFTILPKDD